jgi:hypothetical protein
VSTDPDQALATTIGPPQTTPSRLPCVRADSIRQSGDGDVIVGVTHGASTFEVAIDDPLSLIAVAMAAIKFGHDAEMLAAAKQLVNAFTPREDS